MQSDPSNNGRETPMTARHLDPARRHDFVMLFDVTDGNPNGDPDAGNLPRIDPETMQGLMSDVSLKRKVRDFVHVAKGNEERFKIYVLGDEALNTTHERAYKALGVKSTGTKQDSKTIDQARDWMAANFFDIRMFGAVMTTGVNCGQVRGPVQITFARSIDPIVPLDLSITRKAVTKEEDRVVKADDDGKGTAGKQTEMGRKSMVPYGLYRAHGFFNPHFARQSGATEEDVELLWHALIGMFEMDRSASRGMMALQGLYVFTHDSPLGNAPAHRLFGQVEVAPLHEGRAPRAIADYSVTVRGDVPGGVTLTTLVSPA